MSDLQTKIDELLEYVPPNQANDAITTALHMCMSSDDDLQKTLADLAIQLRVKEGHPKSIDVLKDEAVIVFSIRNSEFKYESFYLLVGMLEFITHLSRKALANQKISPLEYIQFRNLLAQIGFMHLGISKYPAEMGSLFTRVETDIEAKELARKQLLEKYGDDTETMKQFELLGLMKPLRAPMEEITRGSLPPEKVHDLIDEFCRFIVLGEEGAPLKVHFMKFVIEHLGIVPRLNGGYSIVDILSREEGESKESFKKRVDERCKNITRKLYKDLGSHPENYRFGIIHSHFGELNIEGILPDVNLELLDKRPEVQAFINNVRKGGQSQIRDKGKKKATL